MQSCLTAHCTGVSPGATRSRDGRGVRGPWLHVRNGMQLSVTSDIDQTTSDLLLVTFLFRFQKGAKSTLLFADSDKLLNIRIFLIGKMF